MPKFKELWRCGACHEIHDDEADARECCSPEIIELYGCVECGVVHDSEYEAESCCAGEESRCSNCSRDYGETDINAKAIQIAGHCTVCNPLFTLDQRFAIEDMHRLQTGRHGDLRIGKS